MPIRNPSGGGGGGNATVPNDAPIQPAQAFVDAFGGEISSGLFAKAGRYIFSNSGIESLNADEIFAAFLNGEVIDDLIVLLDGNALDTQSIDGVLSVLGAGQAANGGAPGYLDLSGGTNAAPSAQGLIDKATLEANGWTVLTN